MDGDEHPERHADIERRKRDGRGVGQAPSAEQDTHRDEDEDDANHDLVVRVELRRRYRARDDDGCDGEMPLRGIGARNPQELVGSECGHDAGDDTQREHREEQDCSERCGSEGDPADDARHLAPMAAGADAIPP
jgi:hypothetical protein